MNHRIRNTKKLNIGPIAYVQGGDQEKMGGGLRDRVHLNPQTMNMEMEEGGVGRKRYGRREGGRNTGGGAGNGGRDEGETGGERGRERKGWPFNRETSFPQ